MWTISDWIIKSGLILITLLDILWRRIPVNILVILNIMIAGYQLYYRTMDWRLIAGGAGVGIIFFIISRKTGESIGYADSWLILILGIYQGFWGLLGTLTGAMFILAITSLVVSVLKRPSRKFTLPFIPFLTIGYILWMLSEV